MGRRAVVTKAQLARAVEAARSVDPGAIIEVTPTGAIRILPGSDAPNPPNDDAVEAWFGKG